MVVRTGLLEMQAAYACNLTCESCSHFSNNGHRGYLGLDEAEEWMSRWNRRLVPGMFRILGGEPTLNPDLVAFIELAARKWPASRLGLTTNGFFLHRHPELPEVLSRHNVLLHFSIHHESQEYLERVLPILALIEGWRARCPFDVLVEKTYERWTRRYHGFGAAVLPYEDRDPRRSWERCECSNTVQLFRGRLWKCSAITYLQVQKQTYPELSPRWDPYLAYQPLGPECSDGELAAFLGREDESICGMCPADPERFDRPSPLIPLGVLKKGSG